MNPTELTLRFSLVSTSLVSSSPTLTSHIYPSNHFLYDLIIYNPLIMRVSPMNHKLVWGGAHKGYHLSSASAPQHLTSIPLRYIRLSRFRIAYMYHLYPILFALRDLEWDLSGLLNIECHELNSAETELVSPVSLKQLMNQWKPIESYLRRLYVIKSQDFRELQQFSRDHAIDYEYPAFDPHNRIGMMRSEE